MDVGRLENRYPEISGEFIMSFKNLQKQVDDWVSQFPEGYWEPHAMVTHALEELGEVAREVHHIHGPKKRKDTEGNGDLGDEIADVLFSMICLANKHNIDLSEAFEKGMEKRYGRDNNRFDKK